MLLSLRVVFIVSATPPQVAPVQDLSVLAIVANFVALSPSPLVNWVKPFKLSAPLFVQPVALKPTKAAVANAIAPNTAPTIVYVFFFCAFCSSSWLLKITSSTSSPPKYKGAGAFFCCTSFEF